MSNEKDNMSLVEYEEKIAPFPLSNFQKELLEEYEVFLISYNDHRLIF